MVPFSFENIARSASLDASAASPVSETARATHESFESHLQRAGSTKVDQPSRGPSEEDKSHERSGPASSEPSRNEPVRQVTGDSQSEDDDARAADDAEATAATETPRKRSDEDVEDATVAEDEITIVTTTITTDKLQVATREVEPEVSVDSDGSPDELVAAKLSVAAAGGEESNHTTLEKGAEASADDESIKSGEVVPSGREIKHVRSEHAEPTDSEPPTRRIDLSGTNEDVAAEEFPEASPIAETTTSDDKPSKASITQPRHGHRSDISPNRPTHEALDAAPKPLPDNIVETSAKTTSEERQQHRETDSNQPIGKTATADTTTTPGTPSRFAQHLLTRTEDSHERGLNITNADQARFVDRVARAVHSTGERGGTLRLRLSPPELGALTLEVKVQGGVVSARVEADTSAARSLLLEHLPVLRERLAEYGMRVDQFDVDLTDRHAGGTPDGLQQNDQQQEGRPRETATTHDPDDNPQVVSSDTPTNNGSEQLNIIV